MTFTFEELAIMDDAIKLYCAETCFRTKTGMINPIENLLYGKGKEYESICDILGKIDKLKHQNAGLST